MADELMAQWLISMGLDGIDTTNQKLMQFLQLVMRTDTAVQELENSMRDAFSKATGLPTTSTMGGRTTQIPLQQIQQTLSQSFRPNEIRTAVPGYQEAQEALAQRQKTVLQSAMTFAQQRRPDVLDPRAATPAGAGSDAKAPVGATPPAGPGGTAATGVGADATEDLTQAIQDLADQFHEYASTQKDTAAGKAEAGPSGKRQRRQQPGGAAPEATAAPPRPFYQTLLDRIAGGSRAPSHPMSGMVGALGRGEYLSLGRTLTGTALDMLMSAGPWGLAAAAAGAATVGLGLAANATQSTIARRSTQLAAELPGSPGPFGVGANLQALNVSDWGRGWNLHGGDATRLAVQLAMGGVSAGSARGAFANTAALSTLSGRNVNDIAPLTTNLMTRGGMNNDQVGRYFQDLANQARVTGVPLGRLIDDLGSLQAATGQASYNVGSLAAVQQRVGLGVNAGQLMAPALGATGSQAITQMALLGVRPQQYAALQQNPAAMFGAIGQMTRRFDRGPMGPYVAEMMASNFLDMGGLPPAMQLNLMNQLRTATPQNMTRTAAHIQGEIRQYQHPEYQWLSSLATQSANQTPFIERTTIAAENIWQHLVTPTGPAPTAAQAMQAQRTGLSMQGYAAMQSSERTTRGLSPDVGTPAGGYFTHPVTQSMVIPNTFGGGPRISAALINDYGRASRATGVPMSILLAQAARESTVNGQIDPRARSKDGGYGLGQFTDPKAARLYLGQAEQMLGRKMPADWHTAAFDPQVASIAQALYDKANFVDPHSQGKWTRALAMYNGGPNPNAQAQAYGSSVYNQSLTVEATLGGKLQLVDDNNRNRGSVTIDRQRARVGHAPHKPPSSTHHGGPQGDPRRNPRGGTGHR